MVEELFRLTQAETGLLSQDAYPDMSATYPLFTELYRYQVPVDRRLIFRPGHTFSIYAMYLSDQEVDGCLGLEAATYTEETVDANENTADDIVLDGATPATNDGLIVGYRYRFTGLTAVYTTDVVGGTVAWEYSSGASAFTALAGVTDDTVGWTADGSTAKDVTWTLPGGWVQATYLSRTLYWVKCRVVTAGSAGTGDQIWLHPDPTAVDNRDLFKIEVRDQNELVRKPIIQPSQYRQISEFTDRDTIKRLDIAEAVVAKPNDWVVILTKAIAPVDVSGCYFDLTCDREMIHLF